jgi:hypothetical protein
MHTLRGRSLSGSGTDSRLKPARNQLKIVSGGFRVPQSPGETAIRLGERQWSYFDAFFSNAHELHALSRMRPVDRSRKFGLP